jgi:Pro-kumamolisin, activation domain
MTSSSSNRALPGSARPRHSSHKLLGPADPSHRLGITVVVRRNPSSPPLPDLAAWHNIPIAKRRALTRQEYASRYGADPAELEKVAAFAAARGLTVVESHAGRRTVTLEGTPPQFDSAFGITLNQYQAPVTTPSKCTSERHRAQESPRTQTYHSYDGDIHLPDDLHGIVEAVVGLDNRARSVTTGTTAPVAAGAGNDPAGANSFSAAGLAQKYNFPNPGAKDQTIGVHAPQASGFTPSYLSTDILSLYFPGQTSAYQTAPTLNNVNLTVSGTTFQNNTALVQAVTSANLSSAANGAILELTQDISTSSTVAQGATVNVYFTQDSEQGWLVFLNRVLLPEGESGPTVVTSSFTLYLGDDSGTVGKLSDTGSSVYQMTTLFKQLAAVGVDVFIALGDWGADDWWPLTSSSPTAPDGSSHVAYPACDPWVTSVGGTVLGSSSEVVWNDSYSSSNFGNTSNNFGTTGGGVSKTFTASTDAPYQTSAGITGATDSAGNVQTGRGVPDVAGMVALSPFFVNGISYGFTGTSCVAPFYAGLAAVIRSAIGRDLGPFNDTLYALKDVAFNDITSGNNSSLDTPANVKLAIPGYTGTTANAPFFTAAAGWDACTGLGSIDGTKLLNGITSLLYNPNFYFEVNKGSFGLEEAQINAKFDSPIPITLVLEGFSPNAVAAAHIKPTVTASFTQITITVGAAVPEILSAPDTAQRIFFPCTVDFDPSVVKSLADGGIFPNPGDPPTPTSVPLITSSILIGGQALSAESEIFLEPGADPYFSNFATNGDFALSQDLRVFTVCPGINKAPIDSIPLNVADNTKFDTANGYFYIQALLTHLNSTYNTAGGTDPFTLFPDQTNALSGDSSVTPTQVNPASPTGTPFTNYNYAVARVRLSGTPNTSSGANVRVLFRLFVAQTSDTDYQTLTYPSNPDSEGQALSPLIGTGNTTIPFFATGNFESNSDYGINTDYSANSINNQPVQIGASGETWAYYGCYLNIYPTGNTISGKSVQSLLPSTHNCIVAQLVYDQAPMPTGAGVLQGPEYSDNFAQRNLQVTFSDNPGPASAHVCPQTFDARPSLPLGTGQLENYPDELQIDWGNTPVGSVASIYWPAVASSDVLALAQKLYSTNQLSASDANTIQCTVPKGFTFVPIPPASGANFAGLFTVELPQGVTAGQEFTINVRRVSTRRGSFNQPPPQQPQPKIAGSTKAALAPSLSLEPSDSDIHHRVMRNWRYIIGSFIVRIPVAKPATIRPIEKNIYSILSWRLTQVDTGNRWIPVLERYLGYIRGRLTGIGIDPGSITPSPWGWYGPPHGKGGTGHGPGKGGPGEPGEGIFGKGGLFGHDRDFIGKVEAVIYDRFGDFEGFVLLTEKGRERTFFSREAEIESLVRYAWLERVVVAIVTEPHAPERPINVVLLRAPRQPRRPAQ